MSPDKMLLFRLGDFKINGIICSGNEMWNSAKPKAYELTCEDVLMANPKLDGIDFT
jgi:hypothetical protein